MSCRQHVARRDRRRICSATLLVTWQEQPRFLFCFHGAGSLVRRICSGKLGQLGHTQRWHGLHRAQAPDGRQRAPGKALAVHNQI
jgi:hypothetical protein